MHEHQQDDPEVLSEIEKLGYDPRDVPVEKTKVHAVALFIGIFVMMGVGALVMWVFDRIEGSKSVWTQPAHERTALPEDPYPLLQSNKTAKTDIHDLRLAEDVKTGTSHWVDKDQGVVRIPVDRAAQLLLSEGLPQSGGQAAPASVTGEDPAAPGTAVETTEFREGQVEPGR